jgi:hypothetical protein
MLLGLPDPERKGARRVREAILALQRSGLIAVRARGGHPNVVTLLDERGAGGTYAHPGKGPTSSGVWSNRYIRIPSEFWTHGRVQDLSAAAVTTFLILLVELNDAKAVSFWISPRNLTERYGISGDTWSKGTRELRDAGIIAIGRVPIRVNDFEESPKKRNTFRLSADIDNRSPQHDSWDALLSVVQESLS